MLWVRAEKDGRSDAEVEVEVEAELGGCEQSTMSRLEGMRCGGGGRDRGRGRGTGREAVGCVQA